MKVYFLLESHYKSGTIKSIKSFIITWSSKSLQMEDVLKAKTRHKSNKKVIWVDIKISPICQ